jgi:hypothetical protein
MAALRCVGGTPGRLNSVSEGLRTRLRWRNLQPVELTVVREFEDELIDHAVDAYRSTHELQIGICGVVEDEVVSVEDAQIISPDAAGELLKLLADG